MNLVIICHNLRSTYNVGAILRTADGFGVNKIFFTGYTPYPELQGDKRLPHERAKLTAQIHKTALGAEKTVPFEHSDIAAVVKDLRQDGFAVAALEQSPGSVLLPDFQPPKKLALILGEELGGVGKDLLDICDITLEIPMHGKKESFNVSVAAGIAMYALKNTTPPH